MSIEPRKYQLKARAEGQRETRARIARVAAELHEEIGVARTTVAEIARRAGVQRLTVYNHFADLSDLLPACSAHYAAAHPQPDLAPVLALEDPAARVGGALGAIYGWYRQTEPMLGKLHGDRHSVPELDEFMRENGDRALSDLADALAAGFDVVGAHAGRQRALVALALDFACWRRLSREGLSDAAAAELMTAVVVGA